MVKVYPSLTELNNKKERADRNFLLYVLALVIFLLTVTCLNTFVYFNVKVSGSSMSPTLYGIGTDGDVLIANKLKRAEKGDIVIIGGVESYWLIKRVIAVEGETVKIDGGYVYVNGVKIDEPYASEKGVTEYMNEKWKNGYTLKENEIFYLGDNRAHNGSSDSRVKGVCTENNIVGVVENWSLKNKELRRKLFAFQQAVYDFFVR